MNENSKQISNSASTGGLGTHFENRVQTAFSVLMLTGGFSPCLPTWPIVKIKLQGKYQNFETDDLIVYCKDSITGKQAKLIGQIKHSVKITESNSTFGEVIEAAWNDFNNPEVYSTASKDVISLICGPLSATDTNDVRRLLEQARYSEDADDFITRVERLIFTSNGQRKKLDVFRTHLKKANSNVELTKDELWKFLRSFHLLIYDLDIKGVTLSLLHTLIEQYSRNNANALWAQINEHVQWESEKSGFISISSIPEEISTAFKRVPVEVIPDELVKDTTEIVVRDWNKQPNASELVIASIVGSWNENSASDKAIISQLAREEYSDWITKLRDVLQQPESPIALKNGRWRVIERETLWQALGARLFDDNLESFKQCAVSVLTEHDPQFDLPVEERFVASIHGKVLKHSPELRQGLAESLALLGNKPDDLTHCSRHKPETVATLAVREIFTNADWVLWGSLNNLLPVLAEAAPDEFLKIVENALQQTPCPFDELFSQEGDGFNGGNYITGLLWALETLAWDDKLFVHMCVILGELASHDPGGNWVNRPANSLTTILLPWLPQTIASFDQRKAALKTLQKEVPAVAWKLLLTLLPNQHQTSTGTHKPLWRNTIPDDWEKGVAKQEYREQVLFYAELAVSMASHDIAKLNELIDHLDNLPQPSFNKVLEHLSSEAISSKPEAERLPLWTTLTNFTSMHRRYSDAKWALSSDIISKVEVVAAKIAPKNPLNLHRRLFDGRDFDLYEENDNWEEQQQKFEERRQQVIKDILAYGGMDAIIQFAEAVESPSHVGHSLGVIAQFEIDATILPALLETKNKKLAQFASGYVWSRQYSHGWAWVDGLDKSAWSVMQIGQLLSYLPFSEEAWNRATAWLGEFEKEYWIRSRANLYHTDGDIGIAIDKLIEYGRPHAAINCLHRILYNKHSLDKSRSVKALLAAVSSAEPSYSMDTYRIVEIIKALQDDPDINSEDLFQVEWVYLPLIDRDHSVSPKLLENRLASDPAFFCEMIRFIYRSNKEDKSEKEPSEQEKSIGTNAYKLLREWRTPPGMQPDDVFSQEQFTQWLEQTKKMCAESGHLEVALLHIGQVLIYCPPDSQGLWIDQNAADALNGKDAEEMRNGFRLEVFNSRGAYTVDPTGKPERELAEQYRQKADEVENAGYQRFAVTLRSLAESYDRDADQIINESTMGGED